VDFQAEAGGDLGELGIGLGRGGRGGRVLCAYAQDGHIGLDGLS
jgi:hypothetical protein